METLVLRVKPEAKEHLKWFLSHLKNEVEVLSLDELEDLAMVKAIEEGDRGEFVSEDEVMKLLEG